MPASKLTCPDCGKVLRPAKPLPAGKKVKCPECGSVFLAQDDEVPKATITTAAAKRGAKAAKGDAKKAKPAKKPAKDDPDKPPAPQGTIPFADDEDDGPATYAFQSGDKHEEPEIDHVPDTSIKDLRGPAQEAIVRPSNYLILCAGIGLLCYVALFAIIFIPIIFPVPEKIDDDLGGVRQETLTLAQKKKALEAGLQITGAVGETAMEKSEKEQKKKETSLFTLYSWDLMDVGSYRWWVITLLGLACVFGIIYCGVTIYGGVRMQTLESRLWGIISSILAMTPCLTTGIFGILSILGTLLVGLLFGDDAVLWSMPLWAAAAFGAGLGIGIWCLVTLLREDVIAGYEYVEE